MYFFPILPAKQPATVIILLEALDLASFRESDQVSVFMEFAKAYAAQNGKSYCCWKALETLIRQGMARF